MSESFVPPFTARLVTQRGIYLFASYCDRVDRRNIVAAIDRCSVSDPLRDKVPAKGHLLRGFRHQLVPEDRIHESVVRLCLLGYAVFASIVLRDRVDRPSQQHVADRERDKVQKLHRADDTEADEDAACTADVACKTTGLYDNGVSIARQDARNDPALFSFSLFFFFFFNVALLKRLENVAR